MLLSFLLFVLGADLATSQTIEDCPSNLARDKYLQLYGDSCFQFVLDHERCYDGAKDACEKAGGTLALVKTKDIQDFLTDQLQNTYSVSHFEVVWIGLNDIEEEGVFKWVDGTPIEYNAWYQDFDNGDLAIQAAIQASSDCVGMSFFFGGKWGRYECCGFQSILDSVAPVTRPYICQYNLSGA